MRNQILIACGSRNFKPTQGQMEKALEWAGFSRDYDSPSVTVYHGGARGADNTFGTYCLDLHIVDVQVFPADWERHGNQAGYLRNIEMVDAALEREESKVWWPMCVAFWDGKSKGTMHTISYCNRNSIPVLIIPKGMPG